MNWINCFDALDLNYHFISNYQINPISNVDFLALVKTGKPTSPATAIPCFRISCVRQARYALSSSPGPSTVWIFIAAVMI